MRCRHCDEPTGGKKTPMKVCPQGHPGCAVCLACYRRMTADVPPEPTVLTYRVYRFDSETDGSLQTLLGTFPTLDSALAFARRNGGHQVQKGEDGEVTNLQTGEVTKW